MIEFVCEAWYNDKIISNELIYKSFRTTGIDNNLVRKEDDLILHGTKWTMKSLW
jgi:hypothetical protein